MNRELEDTRVLLIDGNNLLHRVSGTAAPGAQRTLLPRLRGVIPTTIATVLMLDGHADSGTNRREKISRGFEIRHSGSMSADDALVRLINEYPPAERAGITLVSDDIRLGARGRHLGARTQRLAWLELLIGIPEAATGTAIGTGRRPTPARRSEPAEDEGRQPWQPGRGATRKKGNPRRRAR